ncbi:MAG TPA: MFS transporter [Rubellimicrobium sp.]|nr:MFS transporter [Rubellimicrobium sp.]
MATTILASSLAFVDGSVVNVGLPAIGESLGAGSSSLQWIVNAYLLPMSALLLVGGALGDQWGRQRVLIAGTAVFGVASLACAIAPGLGWLLLGRFLQGVGAALLMPASLAILGQTFTGEAKGRAVGIWAATGAIAGALGPVLGGWFIDLGSWRAIFLINLPLVAGAIWLAWRYVPDVRDGGRSRLDIPGGLLATLGLGALVWGLTRGSSAEGWSPTALGLSIIGAMILLAFVEVERRRGDGAMVPLALFGSSSFVALTLLTLLLYGALGALFVLLPYVLIQALGYSGTAAGAALLPLPIVLAVVSPFMGSVAGRIGSRLPLALGPIVMAAGILLMLRITPEASYWTGLFPATLIMALGLAGAVAPLTTAVLGSVDDRHTGLASGLNSAVARTGGLVATALLGAVLASQGEALIQSFRIAAVIAAGASLVASGCIWLLYQEKGSPSARGTEP